ncbi:MAG: Uma2 family endonuclease [Rhodobacteraceae bacterium]|nr:Uma2 family endonuclease [Paracoccaceae bacterium]
MNQPAPLKRSATYQDVLDAPENMIAEIIRGALHLQPRPASRHGRAASALGAKIGAPFDFDEGGPGGWWILDEPELHFGDDVLVPDIAGWRRERMPEFLIVAAFTLAPDWVCEVLSPGTRRRDLTDKREIYREQGVGWLWFVDPEARTLEVFARSDAAWVLVAALGGEVDVRIAPFDAIVFPLSALWPPSEG